MSRHVLCLAAASLLATAVSAAPVAAQDRMHALVPDAQPAQAAGTETLRQYLDDLQQDSSVPLVEPRALAVALGAIGGIVIFNLVTGGPPGLPFLARMAPVDIGPMTAYGGAVAVSRVYAVSSAAVGGLIGDYVYRSAIAGRPQISAAVLERISPPESLHGEFRLEYASTHGAPVNVTRAVYTGRSDFWQHMITLAGSADTGSTLRR